ncbi:MAG TPA: HlyD family secretion protein [Rhodocyclaceae bacterium]|nr:HlyD family secretion protein [Rhodocyclaceae bacterium]
MSSAEQAQKPLKKKMRGRAIVAALGGSLLVGGIAYGVQWWQVGRFIESTDNAYLKADSVVVVPKVGGYVAEVLVEANQMVKKGDSIVRLDASQYQALLDQAKGQFEARQADKTRAQSDIAQLQAQVEQAQAQETVSRLAMGHAKAELERYAPLQETGAATAEHVSALRNTLEQAQAKLAASQADLKAARSRLATGEASIAQAEAQQRAAEAARVKSDIDVKDTVLRAAQDGRVGDLSVRVGQLVQPGTRLMSIVPVQQVYLVANYKETQIGRMRIGQAVKLHVDALPGQDLQGTVDSFSPGTGAQFALLPPENATGNFTKVVQRVPVRIRLDADAALRERLLPGMSVTAEVYTRGDTRGATKHD